jgi:uncharacterized protein (DUF427 family)
VQQLVVVLERDQLVVKVLANGTLELNGEAVANSRNTQLVWQGPYPTSYWFPREDVQFALLTPTAQANGRLRWNVRVGDRIAAGAAWHPIDLPE